VDTSSISQVTAGTDCPFGGSEPRRRDSLNLTPQERQLLMLLIDGRCKKFVAREMRISVNTVSFHLKNLYAKLQVNSKTAAVVRALCEGLIRPPGCAGRCNRHAAPPQSATSDIARYSQARAKVQSRSTVASDRPRAAAISSMVRPPKNLSSTI
jgi:DNA-binding CsgD family transcriptional regulator